MILVPAANMIDTHCHLSYGPLLEQIEQVIARAGEAGVGHMIAIGTRLNECVVSLELARKYPQITCSLGVHPHHAAECSEEELSQVVGMLGEARVVAAGEMGLDYHYDFAPRAAQLRVFERQIEAARAEGLPLVLHSRESVADCLAILKSHSAARGVFHCFTGTMDEAKHILDAGFHLGFTGIITFKNTQYLRDILAMVPADRLLLETDAPYLAPEPLRRQKNNEPSLIAHTFARAAVVRGVSTEELIATTTANARRLFALDGR